MITINEAKELLKKNILPLSKEDRPISEALGQTLSKDIHAPHNSPQFDNSAMDGFAVRSVDTTSATPENPCCLKIVGTIRAGEVPDFTLNNSETAGIMTGAPIPAGADAVIKKEDTTETGDTIGSSRPTKKGEFIRGAASEIAEGDILLTAGSRLNPASIGLIASQGISRVQVYRKPRIKILVTGDEVIGLEEKLVTGKIYDTHSFTLTAAFTKLDIKPELIGRVGDSKEALAKRIEEGLKDSDLFLITGGVSVGSYDYVKEVLAGLGTKTLFWRVYQKPGKPLYVGQNGDSWIMGLPGNPASVLVCFYEYVRMVCRLMMGDSNPELKTTSARLGEPYTKDEERPEFVRGGLKSDGETVISSGRQISNILTSFAQADCLICLPEGKRIFEEGEKVKVHLLP